MMPHFHPPKKHVLPVRRTSPLDASCSFHVQRDRNQQKNQVKKPPSPTHSFSPLIAGKGGLGRNTCRDHWILCVGG